MSTATTKAQSGLSKAGEITGSTCFFGYCPIPPPSCLWCFGGVGIKSKGLSITKQCLRTTGVDKHDIHGPIKIPSADAVDEPGGTLARIHGIQQQPLITRKQRYGFERVLSGYTVPFSDIIAVSDHLVLVHSVRAAH